jgi:hypothetical protein
VALKRLREIGAERYRPAEGSEKAPVSLIDRVAEVRHAAAQVMKAQADLVLEFQRRIGSADGALGCALNELMALFTPARWAYEDLLSEPKLEGGARDLALTVGGGVGPMASAVPAELRWNTAELNTCAMSLFLLCGRSRSNPLRLLLLDDPLQNMDELTVACVARGLARLTRLWREIDRASVGWRIVLLLHSEEYADRIRREVPCAFYALPWLSPSDGISKKEEIKSEEPALVGPELQSLEKLLAPRVKKRVGDAASLHVAQSGRGQG